MHLIEGVRKRFFKVFFTKEVNPWTIGSGLSGFIPLKPAGMVPFR